MTDTLHEIEEGGPAFPGVPAEWPGMMLRDWFAGMAMQNFLMKAVMANALSDEEVAAGAYKVADAMLRERER